jgi:hypothetical protein
VERRASCRMCLMHCGGLVGGQFLVFCTWRIRGGIDVPLELRGWLVIG